MRSNTNDLHKLFFSLLLLLLILGCDDSPANSDKSWVIFKDAINKELEAGPKEFDLDGLKNSFSRHFESLQDVVRACSDNPDLRRIGRSANDVSYYKGVSSVDDFNSLVISIQKKLAEIGASSVSCGRRGDFEDNPLAIVSFVMSASGLSVSGSSKGFFYSTEWSQKNNPASEAIFESRGYTQLGIDGWYIYET